MVLNVNSILSIPSKELQWRFSRSSGPGGQSINKNETRVELMFDVKNSSAIGYFRKKKLLKELENHLKNGFLHIVVSEERSQYKNRQIALKRLAATLRKALTSQTKARKATKPTYSSKKRRLEVKKLRGLLKTQRRKKESIDD